MTEDIKQTDTHGLVKSGDAVINTDKEALTAYSRQKAFYRRVDAYQTKVDSLETKIEFLEARVKHLEDIMLVHVLSKRDEN